jgi:tetrahydromethanopterin S-methyltransferase subunit E
MLSLHLSLGDHFFLHIQTWTPLTRVVRYLDPLVLRRSYGWPDTQFPILIPILLTSITLMAIVRSVKSITYNSMRFLHTLPFNSTTLSPKHGNMIRSDSSY